MVNPKLIPITLHRAHPMRYGDACNCRLHGATSGRIARPHVGIIRARARVPLGPVLSIAGIAICVAVITGLKRNELLIMCVPALVATTNWLWVKRQQPEFDTRLKARVSIRLPRITRAEFSKLSARAARFSRVTEIWKQPRQTPTPEWLAVRGETLDS